jgi:hypothetical protein
MRIPGKPDGILITEDHSSNEVMHPPNLRMRGTGLPCAAAAHGGRRAAHPGRRSHGAWRIGKQFYIKNEFPLLEDDGQFNLPPAAAFAIKIGHCPVGQRDQV